MCDEADDDVCGLLGAVLSGTICGYVIMERDNRGTAGYNTGMRDTTDDNVVDIIVVEGVVCVIVV